MKKIIIALGLFLTGIIAFAQPKNDLSLDPQKAEWFKEAKFGMFVHWGLYSILEGSYNGHTLPDPSLKQGKSWYAEWIQMRLEVPDNEYQSLVKDFNPVNFDANQWISEAKNAGVRYFVITAKHHDGFALWKSNVSDFNITRTPYKKDIIAELVKACKKHGIKYGFYYSHWQDWEYPGGALPSWKTKRTDEEFENYWQNKCLPQVKELLVKFDPDLLWFDTWNEENHITSQRRDELIALVRKNSTKCLINGRISFLDPGDHIDFLEMHDNSYPDKILEKPWQTPATMVNSWGWHAKDYNWKSSSEMLGYLSNNASKGGNYLLNIGPKPDGTFPLPAIRRLQEIGAWILVNGEAIYDTRPVKKEVEKGIYLTQKKSEGKDNLYVLLSRSMENVDLLIDVSMIHECRVLESGMPVEFSGSEGKTRISIPQKLFRDCSVQVIKITSKTALDQGW
ncbi:MAG: alpha-L-fucosidase [Bacteroidales bacterium]|nr:alpha-L-fucosidase [Bacteroidales bacterium]